ncbi:MAG TPA: aldose epimerase family protein [Tepidisphaeraceae bacterium]|nr:aldose epimerase family protein [Tepidisphaeraceae bacterium]
MAPLGKATLFILMLGIGLAIVAGCKPKEKTDNGRVVTNSDEKVKMDEKKMAQIQMSNWGKTADGTPVELYTLINRNGVVAKIATYGATLTELHMPDKDGKMGDVVLGFDNLAQYMKESPFFGATTGRVANRIAKGQFTLNGVMYSLAVNNGPNHLHGGIKGIDKAVWKAEPMETKNGPAVKFTHTSPDKEEGYPGKLDISVTYTLTNYDELKLDYKAKTDKATPVNLTHHSYFNLGTPASGDVLDHILMINADRFTPVDATLIPTGELLPVKGTAMDFTTPMAIGSRIKDKPAPDGGYDHNYVLNGKAGELALAARVIDPQTGRTMEIWTTEPGVQFYTGNFLDNVKGKNGVVYKKHGGFCLETQHFPDSPNHPNFPSITLEPGQTYSQVTVHKFYVKK